MLLQNKGADIWYQLLLQVVCFARIPKITTVMKGIDCWYFFMFYVFDNATSSISDDSPTFIILFFSAWASPVLYFFYPPDQCWQLKYFFFLQNWNIVCSSGYFYASERMFPYVFPYLIIRIQLFVSRSCSRAPESLLIFAFRHIFESATESNSSGPQINRSGRMYPFFSSWSCSTGPRLYPDDFGVKKSTL